MIKKLNKAELVITYFLELVNKFSKKCMVKWNKCDYKIVSRQLLDTYVIEIYILHPINEIDQLIPSPIYTIDYTHFIHDHESPCFIKFIKQSAIEFINVINERNGGFIDNPYCFSKPHKTECCLLKRKEYILCPDNDECQDKPYEFHCKGCTYKHPECDSPIKCKFDFCNKDCFKGEYKPTKDKCCKKIYDSCEYESNIQNKCCKQIYNSCEYNQTKDKCCKKIYNSCEYKPTKDKCCKKIYNSCEYKPPKDKCCKKINPCSTEECRRKIKTICEQERSYDVVEYNIPNRCKSTPLSKESTCSTESSCLSESSCLTESSCPTESICYTPDSCYKVSDKHELELSNTTSNKTSNKTLNKALNKTLNKALNKTLNKALNKTLNKISHESSHKDLNKVHHHESSHKDLNKVHHHESSHKDLNKVHHHVSSPKDLNKVHHHVSSPKDLNKVHHHVSSPKIHHHLSSPKVHHESSFICQRCKDSDKSDTSHKSDNN